MNFINTKSEQFFGKQFAKQRIFPERSKFDFVKYKAEISPYFERRDFSVSGMYSQYYFLRNDIKSDQYLSPDLYYFYIIPCLNRRDYMIPYVDKNNYDMLFPDVKRPVTVIKNRNGLFYDAKERRISQDEAVEICLTQSDDCIIKPTIESGGGAGVAQLNCSNRDIILEQFADQGMDFIVQQKLRQHQEMNELRGFEGAFCTMRMLTYRDSHGEIHAVEDRTFLRLGSPGSIVDNACAGGGCVAVAADGSCGKWVFRYHEMLKHPFAKDGAKVPAFAESVDFVKKLHARIHYMDFIGWDVGIGEDRTPVFMELNRAPDPWATESACGPMFGQYIDDVMERISAVKKSKLSYEVNAFRPGYDHLMQIAVIK